MKTIKQLEEDIEDYRKNLRKENVERHINNLVELLYDKLSDEDIRILEISINRRVLEQTQEIIKLIDEIKNPYPEDLFPEIHEELFEEINQELINKFEFPLDRLSANLMRKARENLKEELKKNILNSK